MLSKKSRVLAVIAFASFLCLYSIFPTSSIAQSSTGPVALDAGHGGNDSGAVANGLIEKELTWKVTNYCKQRLEQLGIPIVMVRTSADENPSIYERCSRANNANARCLISFHFNSGASSANGAELLIGNESSYNYWTVAEAKGLANNLLSSFASLGIGSRGIVQRDYGGGSSESYYPDGSMADYYGITRYARRFNMTGNIIEHGFLTNTHDADLFKNESVLQQLGYLDAQAIYATWPSVDDPHWVYDGKGWKWRFDGGSYAVSQWVSSGEKNYYIGSDGYRVYGWNKIDGKQYYFDPTTGVSYTGWLFMWSCLYYFNPSDAAMVTGSQIIDGKQYDFDSNGVLTGWYQDSEGNTYYKDANDPSPKKGWTVIDSKTYYFLPENYHLVKGWATIDSSKYYFDSNTGVVHTGWLLMWDVRYYFEPSTYKMVTGKYTIDGKECTFNSDGVLVGWFTDDQGQAFYYFPSDYHLAKGWNVIEGDKYYFNPDTGVAHSGWLSMWDVLYYFKPSDYKMVTGKYTIDGKEYTFNEDGVLVENSGWYIDDQGHTLYIDPNTGQFVKGWQVIDGEKYYFETDTGYAHSGWLSMWDVKYYFDPADFKMVVGSKTINGHECTFNQDGVLVGWFTDDQGRTFYYFPSDYHLATGWNVVDGDKYYFDTNSGVAHSGWLSMWDVLYYFKPSDYKMVTGKYTIDGKEYTFNEDGVLVENSGWYIDDQGHTLYIDPNTGQFVKGWQVIDGEKYYFETDTGYAHSGWLSMWDVKYYFAPSSYKMVIGKYTIDGKVYTFNNDGVLLGNGNWEVDGQGHVLYKDPSTGQNVKGWQVIDGEKYYFATGTGYAHSGWLTMWDVLYYFKPADFKMVTGKYTIDGKDYYFNEDGVLITYKNTWTDANGNLSVQTQPSTKIKWYDADGKLAWTRTTNTPAMSSSSMTKDAFISSFSKRIAANYPSIYVSNPAYGAQTAQAFAEATWNSAVSEGVRPEFLAAQIADETGWLKFGGAVPASACNFGGIGAVDSSPQSYAVFPNIQTGLLAQAQHIKAYSSTAALNNPCVDPRFNLVTRGIAPYIEDYGWGMWASNPTYNIDLLRIMNTILAG